MKTPVVFIIFKRPDTTAKVFEAIRQAKPPKLLIIADGARPDIPEEAEKCAAARAIIDRVDWDCKILKNYSEINLGCTKRVSSGLDWVFQQVEEAIILEDDCLPNISFFQYCEELLEFYRHDQRIMNISGNNFQYGHKSTKYSYYFSRYPHIWGWATWRRAWQYYDVNMEYWNEVRDNNLLNHILETKKTRKYWGEIFKDTYNHRINTWDYQWILACWIQNGLSITPEINLVSNIGFDLEATCTKDANSFFARNPTKQISLPLNHPYYVVCNKFADNFTQNIILNQSSRWQILKNKLIVKNKILKQAKKQWI